MNSAPEIQETVWLALLVLSKKQLFLGVSLRDFFLSLSIPLSDANFRYFPPKCNKAASKCFNTCWELVVAIIDAYAIRLNASRNRITGRAGRDGSLMDRRKKISPNTGMNLKEKNKAVYTEGFSRVLLGVTDGRMDP